MTKFAVVTKFVVIWHEINDSSVPTNVMGMSELFDSWEKAKGWIDGTICEDEVRAQSERHESLDVNPAAGDGVWKTVGNGQITYYHIEEIEVPDGKISDKYIFARACMSAASEAFIKIEKLCDANSEGPLAHCIRGIINQYMNPLKEFEVSVTFSPSAIVKVKARTAKEAQNIVNSQIDDRTFSLTSEQKSGIIGDILENIESVKVLGDQK